MEDSGERGRCFFTILYSPSSILVCFLPLRGLCVSAVNFPSNYFPRPDRALPRASLRSTSLLKLLRWPSLVVSW
jgi:hypothetical protein